MPQQPPLPIDDIRTDAILGECIQTIAIAKDLPPASISASSTLEELGLDSLDRVSLSFDLEETYGVEIPEHRLNTVQTVSDIVTEIQAALAKRAPAEKSAT